MGVPQGANGEPLHSTLGEYRAITIHHSKAREVRLWEKRNAEFICSIALVDWTGKELFIEGRCKGIIAEKKQGNDGFGYDPLFYIPRLNKTFAQLTPEEKNRISHRGIALKELKNKINIFNLDNKIEKTK